ncbi:PH domain-containing protein [Bariatricus sp. SGI.161]|uniref:PH domain-containing protein n=1 Tax=Bariatricus sp. SGI.161 TaxID=3420550 RepID=UPI003028E43F|nr:PH domain-containing protein [Lachnospiraceae bacterium]
MTFKGKIDIWWYVVIALLNGITLGITLNVGFTTVWGYLILLVLVDLYSIPVLFRNEVIVDKKQVVIHFGLLTKTLPTQEITSIRKMKNYSASFAASFDRVGIESKRMSTVFVALYENREFANELMKLNKKIKYVI